MTLSKKLYATVGATAGIGILLASAGFVCLRSLGEELRRATDQTAIKLDLVNAARARAWEMMASLRGAFLFANLKNQAGIETSQKRWQSVFKRALEQVEELRPLMKTRESRADLSRYEAALHEFEAVSRDYLGFCDRGEFERVRESVPKVERFAGIADQTLNDLKDMDRKELKAAKDRADWLRTLSWRINLSLAGAFLAVSLFAFRGVGKVIRAFGSAIGDLSRGAEQVASAASQVSASSQSLADGASQQAASLEQTLSSSEEINSMARQNSEHTRSAAGLVSESQRKFIETNASLDEMIAAMGEISAHSEKISRILKSIDEIAFQTNILALNAAVEAARAGEAGQGFAVVADEVRNLAHRSAEAASNTAALIEESIAKSSGGQARVDRVAASIRSITAESVRVKTLVDEVNAGSLEQARGTDEIGRAIRQMQELTQNTATHAEESAAAAAALSKQSTVLKETVRSLVSMVG